MGEVVMSQNPRFLICVPSQGELGYLKNIRNHSIHAVFLVMHHSVKKYLEELGLTEVYLVKTNSQYVGLPPIDRVIVLESDLSSTHFFLEIVAANVMAPITVVTSNKRVPSKLYKTLGASLTVYTNKQDIGFLLD